MKYDGYQALAFEQQDGVLTVKLNRPSALNAVNQTLHRELARVFSEIAKDGSVDVVILTGEGRAFSAGGDLAWFRDITPEQLDDLFVEARRIILDLVDLPQPIISAINGVAAGLGATLALFCDVIYMAEDAKISDPHVRIGVTAGDGGAVIWPLLVGLSKAKEFLMTGDSLSAQEADRIGLVNHVVTAKNLKHEAQRMAHRLRDGSRMAIRSTKLSLNQPLRHAVNLVLDASLSLEKECFSSDFHKAALLEFSREKDKKTTAS
jgi:enoyl-CoA hydratase